MNNELIVLRYQQKCFREYAASVGLPSLYTYPDGNPIRPLPPVQTVPRKLMIVGAYPSARFESRPAAANTGRYRLLPVADNLQPFAEEQYFDGVRIRRLESGDGLKKYLLKDLNLSLQDCWVTDLVKVFLYKPEHEDSCKDVLPSFRPPVLRGQYANLADKSLRWLQEECNLCQPRVVVTLGLEVAQAVSGEATATADDLLMRDPAQVSKIGGWTTLFLPHPDACRRKPKWAGVMAKRVYLIKKLLP